MPGGLPERRLAAVVAWLEGLPTVSAVSLAARRRRGSGNARTAS